MVPLPITSTNTGPFYAGEYNETQAAKVTTVAACREMCLSDPSCVQVTFAVRPVDPCVLYSTIYNHTEVISGAVGFVKCAASGRSPTCAHFTTPPVSGSPCVLYRSIDTTVRPKRAHGIEQWKVVGRRNYVQYDWIDDRNLRRAKPKVKEKTTNVVVTTNTSFASDDRVTMRIDLLTQGATAVALDIRVRIPSWVETANVPLRVNGKPLVVGAAGSYVSLERTWKNGDLVSFRLPRRRWLSPYTGWDQIPGYEGKRHALHVGPIVLACVGALAQNETIVIPVDAADAIDSWLLPDPANALRFGVKGLPNVSFLPLMDADEGTTFTLFPVFAGSTKPGARPPS